MLKQCCAKKTSTIEALPYKPKPKHCVIKLSDLQKQLEQTSKQSHLGSTQPKQLAKLQRQYDSGESKENQAYRSNNFVHEVLNLDLAFKDPIDRRPRKEVTPTSAMNKRHRPPLNKVQLRQLQTTKALKQTHTPLSINNSSQPVTHVNAFTTSGQSRRESTTHSKSQRTLGERQRSLGISGPLDNKLQTKRESHHSTIENNYRSQGQTSASSLTGRPTIIRNPEVRFKGVFLAKKSLRKLTVPKEFKLTNMMPVVHKMLKEPPKQLSEADRLYAMLERKGILDIDDSVPMLNAQLIQNYDLAMGIQSSTSNIEHLDVQSEFFSRSSSVGTMTTTRRRSSRPLTAVSGRNYYK